MPRPWSTVALLATIVLCTPLPTAGAAALDAAVQSANFDGVIHAICVYHDEVYVAGTFMHAGSTYVGGIARWDGSQWAALPSPSGAVGAEGDSYVPWPSTLVVFEDRLIVGGRFARIGGIDATHVAAWDGEQWSSLGEGLSERVITVFNWNGTLLAGGAFWQSGDTHVRHLAYWDGVAWWGLGSGVNAGVQAIAEYDGELYIGGAFSRNRIGTDLNRVARWDGGEFRPLGTGLFEGDPITLVFDMVAHGGSLVVAGSFTLAGNVPANRIVRWDGSNWTAMDTGFSAQSSFGVTVGTVAVYGNVLVAGGNFNKSGGQKTSHIAWWDGVSWQPMGVGLDDSVWGLAVYDESLLVSGEFNTAWQQPRSRIAVWSEPLTAVQTRPQSWGSFRAKYQQK